MYTESDLQAKNLWWKKHIIVVIVNLEEIINIMHDNNRDELMKQKL